LAKTSRVFFAAIASPIFRRGARGAAIVAKTSHVVFAAGASPKLGVRGFFLAATLTETPRIIFAASAMPSRRDNGRADYFRAQVRFVLCLLRLLILLILLIHVK
jgi:hypothetical protein